MPHQRFRRFDFKRQNKKKKKKKKKKKLKFIIKGPILVYFRIFSISVRDQNLFHLVNSIGNIFTRGCATRENITDGVRSMK